MKKIAFNLSSFSNRQVGLKVHIINLIKNFSSKKKYLIYLYISKDSIKLLDTNFIKESNVIYLPLSSKSKILKFFYEQIFIPIHAYFSNIRFIHSFDYSNPVFFAYDRSITIHDLNYIKNPNTFSFLQRLIRKFLYPIGLKKSSKIFTISDTIKNEILNSFNYKNLNSKIEVINNGYDHLLINTKMKKDKIYNDSDRPYFLSVGTLNAHKNYDRLIKAFKRINPNYQLVIIGRDNHNYITYLNRIIDENNLIHRVKIITNVTDTELINFYNGAHAIVLPSLYEGFGIPLIEGIFYKKQIICSDIPIFREIGQSLGQYFNPSSIEDISNKINIFIDSGAKEQDDELRNEILNKYKWKNSSEKLLNVINKIL